tara:strand:- start:588 stop:1013 length:426 start_codon:yes stop_codon:yes gene_type:complete
MADNFLYTAGLNHVGSYQSSARPWAKGLLTVPLSGAITTALEVSFPKVSKFVTVRNDGHPESASCTIRLAFASGGLDESYRNYITIAESASFSADVRVTRLYLLASGSGDVNATVVAGLTQIDASHLTSSWEGLDGVSTII